MGRFKHNHSIAWALGIVSLALIGEVSRSFAQQDLPTSQPKIISIYKEQIKTGQGARHAKNGAKWVAAYEKANFPSYYLALASLTGPREVWYLSTFDSYKALGAVLKAEQSEPLASEFEGLEIEDAASVEQYSIIEAAARPDLSFGQFPDISKARFFTVTTFRVKPGHDDLFNEAAKVYAAASKRAAPNASYRVYQITAGEELPTYLVFSSVEDFAQLDQKQSESQAIGKSMSAEEKATVQKCNREGILSVQINRYRVDPGLSYVSKSTREKDAEFWSKK